MIKDTKPQSATTRIISSLDFTPSAIEGYDRNIRESKERQRIARINNKREALTDELEQLEKEYYDNPARHKEEPIEAIREELNNLKL